MEKQNVAKFRRDLAMAMAAGQINDALRQLKNMPITDLEALSDAESRGVVDDSGLDDAGQKDLKRGIEKLNFYICGILMHRILDGE